MARGRMINQTIATDKRLNSLSIEAELVYLMTVPHLDRDGLILGEHNMLASQVCPRRSELRGEMQDIISEWIQSGLVVRYEGKEDPILFFVGFAKNQGGLRYDRETPSEFPPPPGYKRTSGGLEIDQNYTPPTDSGTPPAELRQESGTPPAEINRSEENGGGVPPNTTRTRQDFTRQQAARYGHRHYEGVDPKLLTTLTNGVKRIYGFAVLIDKPGDDQIEDRMRDEAYRLWQAGISTPDSIQRLEAAWRTHAERLKDKRPYKDQLYEVALTLVSAKETTVGGILDISIGELA